MRVVRNHRRRIPSRQDPLLPVEEVAQHRVRDRIVGACEQPEGRCSRSVSNSTGVSNDVLAEMLAGQFEDLVEAAEGGDALIASAMQTLVDAANLLLDAQIATRVAEAALLQRPADDLPSQQRSENPSQLGIVALVARVGTGMAS